MTIKRDHWGTKLGLVLAMAGNAVGLGNFLRFPVQAAGHGGGAFMIPYLIAMVLLAVPLMWVEWGMGRFGGARGHGSTPGMFHRMWDHPIAKYLGVFGLFLPLLVIIYYVYIESWTLAYSVYSITGEFDAVTDKGGMVEKLDAHLGKDTLLMAFVFFLITMVMNVTVIYQGISKGIERLAKFAMPALFLMAVILVVRVFTLGAPDPSQPDNNIMNGFAFIWEPDFSQLTNPDIWLAATGQVFFTLSLGFGAIQTYASYVKPDDDVALTGLSTAMTNEMAEIVLGGSIAIPLACAFFGVAATVEIAQSGSSLGLGFLSLPLAFNSLPGGAFFGLLWFLLLFFAGITSSVALTQPMVSFLEDELKIDRKKAVLGIWAFIFLAAIPVILGRLPGIRTPFLNELDFWAGTFGIVVFAFFEVFIFAWIFGIDKGWEEITRGSKLAIPTIFKYIIKYVTPTYILILLIVWTIQMGMPTLLMKSDDATVARSAVSYILQAELLTEEEAAKLTATLTEHDLTGDDAKEIIATELKSYDLDKLAWTRLETRWRAAALAPKTARLLETLGVGYMYKDKLDRFHVPAVVNYCKSNNLLKESEYSELTLILGPTKPSPENNLEELKKLTKLDLGGKVMVNIDSKVDSVLPDQQVIVKWKLAARLFMVTLMAALLALIYLAFKKQGKNTEV